MLDPTLSIDIYSSGSSYSKHPSPVKLLLDRSDVFAESLAWYRRELPIPREQPSGSYSEWPSGLFSHRQVTEVKLGRVRSDSGWVTSEA